MIKRDPGVVHQSKTSFGPAPLKTSCKKASGGNLRAWQAGRVPQMLRGDPKVLKDLWLMGRVPSAVELGALAHVA